ncbi:hypothetical protein Q5H93_18225 [Hymenobacter sp. ASUV-10]|uniref:Uncharacterized protein n=1 Tax=Hymenobacter aranciens TaxID=3063996 RepID=A0ABT9BJI2_9BACT|nr:hypothetical protein [Hymenobacter sp. ASUV-10]MDO7876688.1 hypothetical protein [Hymenobacter sp. ASUV-10]
MKRVKQLEKAFGHEANEAFVAFPPKVSNVQLARTVSCKKECSFCFPHGFETSNSTIMNRQRNWKRFRATQWKN